MLLGLSTYWPAFLINISFYIFWTICKKQLLPLDCNIKLYNKRIIGDSRGFDGFIVVWLYAIILTPFHAMAFIVLIGAYMGTIVNSIIKRRCNIKDCIILDQIDFVVGAGFFMYVSSQFSIDAFIGAILIALVLHPTINMGRKTWESFM